MSRETEHMYKFKCDSPKCSSSTVSISSVCPVNWIYTSAEDDNSSTKILRMHSTTPHQIAELRDGMHFCCTGCLVDYLAEQIGRLDSSLGKD